MLSSDLLAYHETLCFVISLVFILTEGFGELYFILLKFFSNFCLHLLAVGLDLTD